MKNNFVIKLLFLLTLCASIMGISVHGEDATTGITAALTGHQEKEDELSRRVTDIVIAKFTSVGSDNTDALGAASYGGAHISVVSSLKGSVSGDIAASYIVQTIPVGEKEAMPTIGTQYIMFLRKLGPNEVQIMKLMLATDQKIKAIKALIASP